MKNTFTEVTKPIIHKAERLLQIKTPSHREVVEMVGINNWKESRNQYKGIKTLNIFIS